MELTPTGDLLQTFPITDYYELSSGTVCEVPFYCRDAAMTILHGTGGGSYLRSLLAHDPYHPVRLSGDRGAVTLWIVDYRDTTCGRYREVVFSFAVGSAPIEVPLRDPMDILAASGHPEARTFIQRIFLDQPIGIQYGREVLGLPKHPRPHELDLDLDGPRARFSLAIDGAPVLEGDVGHSSDYVGPVRASSAVVSPADFVPTRVALHLEMTVSARPFGAGDRLVAHPGTELGDHLIAMDFRPLVVQSVPQAKFVMPKPLNWRSAALTREK